MYLNKFFVFVCLAFLIALFGCAPSSRGPVAMAYHNTTSHYNAYFLAREKMHDMELTMFKNIKDNYNRTLQIYPKMDKASAEGAKATLDDIIKKSSMPIQWHKYSKWVDDAYFLIGKCRFYDLDWENAIITFKYINSKSEDDDNRHQALIMLLRTFMENKEWQSAKEVVEFIENERLSKNNAGEYSLAATHYYLKLNDPASAYSRLKGGVRFVKPKLRKAKGYYILGQLTQQLENDKEALVAYKRVVRLNPTYELWFNAKLNVAQLTELKNEKDAEKIMKFYKKLLIDIKNEEYKDKIYFEMARFEYKRKHYDEALVLYKQSSKEAKGSVYVKSYAFLRIAEIYYDLKQDFEKSSIYYDSTIAILDKDLPEYPKALKRQKILAEFVKQLKIVRKEDSLQKLSQMDTSALNQLVDKWIEDEKSRKKEEDRLAKKQARQQQQDTAGQAFMNKFSDAGNSQAGSNGKWYFYNPTLVSAGIIDFQRKWGTRPLEDNWRRSNKEKSGEEEMANANAALEAAQKKDTVSKDTSRVGRVKPREDSPRAKYLKDVPFSAKDFDSSRARLNRALFKLARIYNQNLEEPRNASVTYDRFIRDFPLDDKVPEALYANYLIFQNKLKNPDKEAYYKNILLTKYPNSLYAKLILNPNYLQENKILGEKVKALYRNAFELYQNGQYLEAQSAVEAILAEFPGNDFEDRIVLLQVMITGQTQNPWTYKKALVQFKEKFPKSGLNNYVDALIAKVDEYMLKAISHTRSDSGVKRFVTYHIDLNLPHYFVVTVPKHQTEINEVLKRFKKYNDDFFTVEKLTAEIVPFTDSLSLLVIRPFPNSIQGNNYYEKQKTVSSPLSAFQGVPFKFFIITNKNFDIFRESRNLNSYLEFFRKNY